MGIQTFEVRPKQLYGIDESLDESLQGWNVAREAINVDLSNGVIETCKGYDNLPIGVQLGVPILLPVAPAAIKKVFILNATYTSGGAVFPIQKYIIGTGDSSPYYHWYAYYFDGTTTAWKEIKDSAGASTPLTGFVPEKAKVVAYKDGSDDCLVISAKAGVIAKIKYSRTDAVPAVEKVYAETVTVASPLYTNGMVLHKERLWTIGAESTSINAKTVYYSNAYDPDDWTTAGEAGSITIETFDGDSVGAIANLLDDVVIFKNNTIHRVVGDIPSEYSTEQIYAVEGALFPNSVCLSGGRAFFAGNNGIYEYLGIETRELVTDRIKDIMERIIDIVDATVLDGVIYMSCIDTNNNKFLLMYNLNKKTLSIENIAISSMLIINTNTWVTAISAYKNDKYLAISISGIAYVYKFGISETFDGTAIAMSYQFPKTVHEKGLKTLDFIKFTGQCTAAAGGTGDVKLTVYYDGKTKEKMVTLAATEREYKIRIGKRGRIFGLKVENVAGSVIRVADISAYFQNEGDL